MDYFYKECLKILFKPFSDLPEWRKIQGAETLTPSFVMFTLTSPEERTLPLTREETNRYVYLCDLFHNFISQHSFRSHFYMMSSNIMVRVASLLKAKDKHLRHGMNKLLRSFLN
jgi:protein phosphatase 4 regulatory subunit 3